MQESGEEVENADGSTNAYLQPHGTSAPMEQNAGSLAVVASTQGALMHHCNSQGSLSEAAYPFNHPVMAYAACILARTSGVLQDHADHIPVSTAPDL
jgi:hypothetical protein